MPMPISESQTQQQIAVYLRLNYPNVMFHSDFGAGVHLTSRQAATQKRQNGGQRAWPDMFVAEPNKGYSGLFIELKREGTRLKRKDGKWASPHLEEQAEVLDRLRFRGYKAEFACGFDEARNLIDEYLKGEKGCDTIF